MAAAPNPVPPEITTNTMRLSLKNIQHPLPSEDDVDLFSQHFNDAMAVVKTPEGIDSTDMVRSMWAKYNLSLGTGLDQVKGKVFRIGHLGDMNEVMLLGALAGTEMGLIDAGVQIEAGAGVGAALEFFQETSAVIPSRHIFEYPGDSPMRATVY